MGSFNMSEPTLAEMKADNDKAQWLLNLKLNHGTLTKEQQAQKADEYEQDQITQETNRVNDVLSKMMDIKYIDAKLPDFTVLPENKITYDKIIDWLDNYKQGKWLVLKGPQGCGKTLMKNIIIRELYTRYQIRSYATTHYGLFTDYLDSIQNGTNKALLTKLGNKKMLIIDEIGRRKQTEAFGNFLFEVIDRIYLNEGSALLITNAVSVKDYIDLSRLNECGIALALTGKDWRKQ